MTTLYETGEKAPATDDYEFVKYTDGTTTPAPTAEERIIPLDKGETFPPVKSADKACYRKRSS